MAEPEGGMSGQGRRIGKKGGSLVRKGDRRRGDNVGGERLDLNQKSAGRKLFELRKEKGGSRQEKRARAFAVCGIGEGWMDLSNP